MKEAVIELNYWCSSKVTYRTTDNRTASPITVYNNTYGRCGEESTFAVSVFRSVGIPARQVYVPLWSHCDDNHAWVEVWCAARKLSWLPCCWLCHCCLLPARKRTKHRRNIPTGRIKTRLTGTSSLQKHRAVSTAAIRRGS